MPNRRRSPLVGRWAVFALVSFASGAKAQSWTPVGPTGGDVRALAMDPREPRVVYLGTADGVLYRSDDAGLRWSRLSPGFPTRGMSLDSIVVDRLGRIEVGYWEVNGSGGGVARSTDGGHTFTVLEGIRGHSVRALAASPTEGDVLVAGTIDGVFRSDDAGERWLRISPEGHPGIHNVGSIAIDAANTVYAGTWHLPWKTSDSGRTWREAHAGMIEDSDIFTLVFDRRDSRTMYATACTGIYRSKDAAGHWTKLSGIPADGRRTRSFAQGERPEDLYAGTTAGLYISEDDARTWRIATGSDVVVNAIALVPRAEGGSILLGTEGAGVLRSEDGGRSWASSNEGFREQVFSRVLIESSGRIVASVKGDRAHGGVFQSGSAEGPWTPIGSGLEGREVLALALDEGEVLAGTDDGLFRSASHCGLWSRWPTTVDGIDAHPHVADLVVLPGRVVLAATTDGLLSSFDGGQSWQRRTLGFARSVLAIAASTTDPRVVLAVTPLGTFRSGDSGATWEQVALGLADPDITIHSLAFLPGSGSVVFAATRAGLLRSTDQGHVWKRCRGTLPYSDIAGLAVAPDGHTVYVSDYSFGGLYRSGDLGETWDRLPAHGLASDRIWSLAVDPLGGERILASASTGGLHLFRPQEAPQPRVGSAP